MAKGKYKFNPESLTFNKVEYSILDKIKVFLTHFGVSILLAVIAYALLSLFYETPRERRLRNENEQLALQYQILDEKLNNAVAVLQDIQNRDDNVYRSIFGAEPIPASVRKAGIGGVDRYAELAGYDYSSVVINTAKKVDDLSHRLVIQSKSFDEVIDLVKNQEKMLSSIPAIQPIRNKQLLNPPYGYGPRIDPVYKTPAFHHGLDFSAPEGTQIFATGDGTVIKADASLSGYGNHVQIDHGFGYKTLYAHMSKILVHPGQKVKRGDVIGLVGNTGKSVGSHLHYEVYVNGKDVNPINFFFNDLTPDQYEKLVQQASNTGQSLD